MASLMRRSNRRTSNPKPPGPAAQRWTADQMAIPDNDPLHAYLATVGTPVALADLKLMSPTLDRLRNLGVENIIPLVGNAELLGALYLGPRLSDQPYSSDDRKLLSTLAAQVAPAMHVAQLVQEQQLEAKERERIHQELEVAALIQHTLLPKQLPRTDGWAVDAFYRPARSVGGDFYDFIDLGNGNLGVTIGDVTDKGVPAALVMATCRSMLRAAATRHDHPGDVLIDVNEMLVDEIPPAMFVTCLYAIIDTRTGEMTIANAGQNLPYVRTGTGVIELRATGMPLGLMKGMTYEERRYQFVDGDVMVLTSDGITEAHDVDGEMYGFPRLLGRVAARPDDGNVVGALVADVEKHTGSGAEQEDDITIVVVKRTTSARDAARAFENAPPDPSTQLASFTVASVEGNERTAIDLVIDAVSSVGLTAVQLDRLKTAVGETVMNAIEHGNDYREDLDVTVEVASTDTDLSIRVTDHGGNKKVAASDSPDIEAKLAGDQTPRGWGLFLIEKMVDELRTTTLDGLRTVELIINIGKEPDDAR